MLPQDPDYELVDRAKKRDKQAFVALFDKYKDKIFAYLYGYLKDYEKARDVTLYTFMAAYEELGVYRARGKFSSWLYAIATNSAKKELRKTIHLKEVSLEEPLNCEKAVTLGDLIEDNKNRPDYLAVVADLKEFIYSLLSKLNKKYREVLLLCDMQEMSYDEAAKVLKCSPITIGTRVRRGRRKFYKLLKKYKNEL